MTYLYIPKDYNIIDDVELTETLKSPYTYKSAILNNRTVKLSESGHICAFGYGQELLKDGKTSSVESDYANAWIGQNSDTATLNGNIVHLAPCNRIELPDLKNENFTPLEYSVNTKYNNNFSETGQFIGRSIVNQSREVEVSPLSFEIPIARAKQILTLLKSLRDKPIYVKILAPLDAEYCVYGWTEGEPSFRYLNDYGMAEISFKLRSTL